jgi:hypothetical protein
MKIENLIQCPDSQLPMRKATGEELDQLRAKQQAGNLFNRLGRKVDVPITAGYVSEATRSFYCVVNEVVWLVAEEAIPLDS